MKLTIATGCSGCGWEALIPRQGDVRAAGESYSHWLDEWVPPPADGKIEQLQPATELMERLAGILANPGEGGLLLSDGRNLRLLDFFSQRYPEAKFLLFYCGAEAAVSSALRQGAEPEAVLRDWQAITGLLLQFRRRHRQRALLLDATMAIHHPAKLTEACRKIGLQLESGLPQAPASTPPIERWLAASLVASQPALQTRQAELEAAGSLLGDTSPQTSPQIRELFDDLLQRENEKQRLLKQISADAKEKLALAARCGELEEKHKDATEENELLLLQVHQVQEELEQYYLDSRKQAAELKKLQSDVAALVKEKSVLAVRRDELQSALEAARREARAIWEKRKAVTQEKDMLLQQLQQANAALVKEKSALAAQRRELGGALVAARREARAIWEKRKAITQEKEILLQQLQQVQKKLEQGFNNNRRLTAELQEKNAKLDESHKQLEEAKRTLREKAAMAISAFFRQHLPTGEAKRQKRAMIRQAEQIRSSGLFDEAWYLAQYEDVRQAGCDPVLHYLKYGAAENRRPSPGFDSLFYLKKYPDVAAIGINPLVHYIRFGKSEGRVVADRRT